MENKFFWHELQVAITWKRGPPAQGFYMNSYLCPTGCHLTRVKCPSNLSRQTYYNIICHINVTMTNIFTWKGQPFSLHGDKCFHSMETSVFTPWRQANNTSLILYLRIQQTHPPCPAWPLITHTHNWLVLQHKRS